MARAILPRRPELPGARGRSVARVQSVDRAVDLLMAFTSEERWLSLAELAVRTRLSKPTAYRLLATLLRRGLVAQDEATGRYGLGLEVHTLASLSRTDLRERALPIMRWIRDAVNETVVLGVRDGDDRVHIEHVESLQPYRRTSRAGERIPLYAGAGSKVLLAGMDDREVDAYLARTRLVAFSPTTITEPARLRAEVALIRDRGYAESRNERNYGGAGVAAPVRDRTGAVVAVLHVSAPEARYTPELRERCIAAMLDGVERLSRALGYRPAGTAPPAPRTSNQTPARRTRRRH